MKVYFDYTGEPKDVDLVSTRMDREAYKVKITLPAKWIEGPAQKLLTYFVDTYNKKFPEKPLVAEEMKLQCRGVQVPLDATVSKYVEEYNDLLILHEVKKKGVEKAPEGSLLCTNFGCGKRFMPDENGPEACRHHAKGPVFHDTFKYWSCCPDNRAMDFDDFEKIEPCVVGPHSTENAPVQFKAEEVLNQALTPEQAAAMKQQQQGEQMMADGPRRTGPREFEEAAHQQSKPQQIVDGKATCRNFGCQKEFVVAENNDSACRYHCEGPVFWDTYKYWKCCPEKKCIEFDDFTAVPGCTTGAHKL